MVHGLGDFLFVGVFGRGVAGGQPEVHAEVPNRWQSRAGPGQWLFLSGNPGTPTVGSNLNISPRVVVGEAGGVCVFFLG